MRNSSVADWPEAPPAGSGPVLLLLDADSIPASFTLPFQRLGPLTRFSIEICFNQFHNLIFWNALTTLLVQKNTLWGDFDSCCPKCLKCLIECEVCNMQPSIQKNKSFTIAKYFFNKALYDHLTLSCAPNHKSKQSNMVYIIGFLKPPTFHTWNSLNHFSHWKRFTTLLMY